MVESTAFKADSDMKGIAEIVLQLQTNDYWKKFYPDLTQNEFCLEVFHRPASWIDDVIKSVKNLHKPRF